MSCGKWIRTPAAVLQGRIRIYSGPFMFMSLQTLSRLSGAKLALYLCILMLDCECSFQEFRFEPPPSVPNIGSSIWYAGDLLRDRTLSKDRHELKKTIHTLQTSWRLLSWQLNSLKHFSFWTFVSDSSITMSAREQPGCQAASRKKKKKNEWHYITYTVI